MQVAGCELRDPQNIYQDALRLGLCPHCMECKGSCQVLGHEPADPIICLLVLGLQTVVDINIRKSVRSEDKPTVRSGEIRSTQKRPIAWVKWPQRPSTFTANSASGPGAHLPKGLSTPQSPRNQLQGGSRCRQGSVHASQALAQLHRDVRQRRCGSVLPPVGRTIQRELRVSCRGGDSTPFAAPSRIRHGLHPSEAKGNHRSVMWSQASGAPRLEGHDQTSQGVRLCCVRHHG